MTIRLGLDNIYFAIELVHFILFYSHGSNLQAHLCFSSGFRGYVTIRLNFVQFASITYPNPIRLFAASPLVPSVIYQSFPFSEVVSYNESSVAALS